MNFKRSKQRERILEVLKETKAHPTADWVYQRLKPEMPNLSLGTVYRNLNLLADQGKIQRMPIGSNSDRFDGDTSGHYHLVCEECGSVQDLGLPSFTEIDKLALKHTKFKIMRHHLQFYGICENCQNKNKNQSPKKKER